MKRTLYAFLILVILTSIALGISYIVSGGASVINNHVIIQKSQDTVFNFVADMRNELVWNPDAEFMEKITDGPIGIDTRFRAKWHLSDTLEVKIIRYEPPNYITFVNGGSLEVKLELSLSYSDNRTEMDSKFIATPHGFLRAIFPVMKSQLKSQEQENMKNLKTALEEKY